MMEHKEAGHTFLARMGKTRLRPGGRRANAARAGMADRIAFVADNALDLDFAADGFVAAICMK